MSKKPPTAPPDLAAERDALKQQLAAVLYDYHHGTPCEQIRADQALLERAEKAEAERDAARVKALEEAAAIADQVVSFWPHGSGRHELAADIAATIRALKDKP